MTLVPVISQPLRITACEGEVVMISVDHGGVAAALTPEAALAMLEPLRAAVDEAIAQRRAMNEPN